MPKSLGGTIERDDQAGPLLTLPESVFLLARRRSGFMIPSQSIREALLGAAVLGELRLLHRIDLDQDGTIRVYDPAPTGVPSLDAVLDRIQTEEPRRPDEWAKALGPDAHAEVVTGLRRVCVLEPGGNLTWLPGGTQLHARLRQATRARIVAAMRARHTDGPTVTLGVLLWGAELTADVLRTSYVARIRLADLAERDWLALAIRRITGNLPFEYADRNETGASAPEPAKPVVPQRWSLARRVVLMFLPLALVGGALIGVSVQAQRRIDAYTADLRDNGVAIEALVAVRRHVDEEKTWFGRTSSTGRVRITVTLAYEHEGRAYREQITCEGACPEGGQTARIWAARDDPTDFVTEWGDYNTPPSQTLFPGLVGGMLVAIALFALLDPFPGHRRRRTAPASATPTS